MPELTLSRGAGYGSSEQSAADDFTLITRAKAGEREAFGLLTQRYGKAVLNLIHKMIDDMGSDHRRRFVAGNLDRIDTTTGREAMFWQPESGADLTFIEKHQQFSLQSS